jgi:Zn-finger nucleic acid-binding protein
MHPYRSAGEPTASCPRCQVALERQPALAVRDLAALSCPRCRGVWLAGLDEARLRHANDRWVAETHALDVGAVAVQRGATAARIDCPACRKPARRIWLEASGIDVDLCDADGVWFDASELRALWGSVKSTRQSQTAGALGVFGALFDAFGGLFDAAGDSST